MFIYLMILGVTMFLSFAEFNYKIPRSKKKVVLILLSGLFVFLSTVRTVPAGDYETYKIVFEKMCSAEKLTDLMLRQNQFYEFLYSTVMFLCKWITNEFHFFLFILAIIVAVLQYRVTIYWGDQLAEQGNGNSYELTAYFVLWTMYFGNIFVIRSTLALFICLYALRYIEKKKPIVFLTCIIVATLFHYSAIFFIFAYIIYHYKGYSRNKGIILIVGTALSTLFFSKGLLWISPFMPTVIQNKINMYYSMGNNYENWQTLSLAILVLKSLLNVGVVLFLCFYLLSKRFVSNIHRDGCINLYIFGAILYIPALIQSYDLARLAQYYIFFQVPIFFFFFKLHEKSRNKMIYILVFYAYMCFRFAATLYSGTWAYIPFTTILG